MTPFKLQGIIVFAFLFSVGIALLFCRQIDSVLSDKKTSEKEVRRSRLLLGIFAILMGIMSLLSVLLGWPVAGSFFPPR